MRTLLTKGAVKGAKAWARNWVHRIGYVVGGAGSVHCQIAHIMTTRRQAFGDEVTLDLTAAKRIMGVLIDNGYSHTALPDSQ
jgi:hypothetical protein